MTSERVSLVAVADDLSIVAKTAAGAQVTVTLAGVKVSANPQGARDELKHLLATAKGLRIVPEADAGGGPAQRAFVEFLALQDRSGSVWLDAGRMLLSLGLAATDGAPFSRRADYQRTEVQAASGQTPRYPLE